MADPVQPGPPSAPGGPSGPAGPSGPRATFLIRFFAALVDGMILVPINLVVTLIVGDIAGQAVTIIVGIAYWVYFEGSPSGQTVGKRVLGIRVVDLPTSGRIDHTRAFIRYIGRFVSSVVCLLGYFWMLWDPQRQTWHDKMAKTVVVPVADYPVEKWPGY